MIKISFIGKYRENLEEVLLEDPSLEEEINQRVRWFTKNPEDTRLENHVLTGKMEGKSAFGITSDIRIIYEWLGKTSVRFLAIGRHKKVYS